MKYKILEPKKNNSIPINFLFIGRLLKEKGIYAKMQAQSSIEA